MQLTSGLPTYLYAYEGGRVRVVCPIAEREFGGPGRRGHALRLRRLRHERRLGAFPEDWGEFARARGWVCGYLALNPLLCDPRGFADEEVHVHNRLFVMDLRGSDADLRRRLSKNRRRELRDWPSVAARLEHDRTRLSEFLLSTYADFFAGRGLGAPRTSISGRSRRSPRSTTC